MNKWQAWYQGWPVTKGSGGSGNWGHTGYPGVGGSSLGTGLSAIGAKPDSTAGERRKLSDKKRKIPPKSRVLAPKGFTKRDGSRLTDDESKLVEESNANSTKVQNEDPSRASYYLTKKDLNKINLTEYEGSRKYIKSQKKRLGKGYGLKMRDAAVSAMKGHPEYMRGLGQARYDQASGRGYDEARPGSFYNLGYYRGYMNYKRDIRGGLKVQLPE